MAILDDIKTELADLKTTVQSEHDQAAVVLQKVVDLEKQIADLVAGGSGISLTDAQDILSQIKDVKTGVSGIIPDVPEPTPTA